MLELKYIYNDSTGEQSEHINYYEGVTGRA